MRSKIWHEYRLVGATNFTGLAVGLMVLSVLAGCSTTTADQHPPRGGPVEPRSTLEPSVRAPSRVTSVTIRTMNGKFLVPVVLNDTQTATFLLDTGANSTFVTPNLARTVNAQRSSTEPRAKVRMANGQEVEVLLLRMKSIAVGSARVEDFGVVVYEIPAVTGSAGPAIAIDGLLGTDFLGRFTMTLDPKAGTLQLDESPVK